MKYTEISKTYRNLLLVTAMMTVLLVILGGIVCMTESSRGCPDWPGCYGEILPPVRTDAMIEFTHRLTAALTGLLILLTAIVGAWKYRNLRWVSRPPMIAVVLLVVVAMFGALTVVRGLSPPLAAVDLGLALLVLALMITASVVALHTYENPAFIDQLTLHTPFAKLAFATVAVLFIVLVSGVLVADGGSIVRCLGWPLFSIQFIPENVPAWLPVLRHTIGLLATILLFFVVLRAWRQRQAELRIWRATIVVMCSFLAEILIGILLIVFEFEPWLLVAYVVAAAVLWTSLVVVTVLACMDPNHNSIKEAS